jgi:integrase
MPKRQKSGLYRTKVKIGVDADGKPLLKWISGKTKRELEESRREVEEFYISGTGLRDDRLFGDFAVEWYRIRKEPFISPSSQASYRTMLNKHVLPAFGDRNLRAIQAGEIQAWLNGFTGRSDTTIALALTVIRGIMQSACADRIVGKDPTAYLMRPKQGAEKSRRALTTEETSAVLRVIGHHNRGDYLAVMYYLGVRPGEARGLKWGDFDWNEDMVHIQRDIDYTVKGATEGELKSEAADRFVTVPPELRSILYARRGHPKAFLFPGERTDLPLAKSSAERLWLDLMRMAGLVEERESEKPWKQTDIRAELRPLITPHYLRHNYITMCWEAGIDPMITMRMVGHADYRTTANIYTHLTAEHLKRTRQDMGKVFKARATGKVAQKLHKSAKRSSNE